MNSRYPLHKALRLPLRMSAVYSVEDLYVSPSLFSRFPLWLGVHSIKRKSSGIRTQFDVSVRRAGLHGPQCTEVFAPQRLWNSMQYHAQMRNVVVHTVTIWMGNALCSKNIITHRATQ